MQYSWQYEMDQVSRKTKHCYSFRGTNSTPDICLENLALCIKRWLLCVHKTPRAPPIPRQTRKGRFKGTKKQRRPQKQLTTAWTNLRNSTASTKATGETHPSSLKLNQATEYTMKRCGEEARGTDRSAVKRTWLFQGPESGARQLGRAAPTSLSAALRDLKPSSVRSRHCDHVCAWTHTRLKKQR